MKVETKHTFQHGSLFSGIGGFDLASEWMGWDNRFHCEWNEFGQKVLNYYWPKAISYKNIIDADFTIWNGRIDILTGGFPCQPYSVAGKRKGKEDERHLWPEMLRAVREIQPRWVVGENVPGLINWDAGVVFEEVQTDLEDEGYEVIPFILPAAGVNAPHRRDRVWFVAYANDKGRSSGFGQVQGENGEIPQRNKKAKFSNAGAGIASNPESDRDRRVLSGMESENDSDRQSQECRENDNESWHDGEKRNVTNTDSPGKQGKSVLEQKERKFDGSNRRNEVNAWEIFPTQSPICNGDDGLSDRLDGITFPKWRAESIKAGGNAIVPQVVYQIFKAIEQYESAR